MPPFGLNVCAWTAPIPRDLTKVPGFGRFAVMGVCRSCGRSVAQSNLVWVDIMGYEPCPTPWEGESALHRAIADAPAAPTRRRAAHVVPRPGGHAA